MQEEGPAGGGRARAALRTTAFVVLLVAAIGVVVFGDAKDVSPARLRSAFDGLGPLGPLVYLALCVVAALLLLPGTLVMVAGALAFPLWLALPRVWAGSLLGATACFLVARHLGREALARRLRPRIGDLDDQIGRNGFRIVLLLRLVGVPPINVMNYAAGLTQVRLTHYVLATGLGILPFLAAVVTIVARLGAAPTPGQILTDPVLWAAVLLVLVVAWVAHRLRPRAKAVVTPPAGP